jgi:hypothetical protein
MRRNILLDRMGAILILFALFARVPVSAAAAERPFSEPIDSARSCDFELAVGGILTGRSVTARGEGITNQKVTLSQAGKAIASVATAADGSFRMEGLGAGYYQLAAGEQLRSCRCWAAGSGPPAACRSILLVRKQTALRGQGPTASGWAMAGGLVIVTGITLAVIEIVTNRTAS